MKRANMYSITEARQHAGLTLQEWAAALMVDVRTASKWEDGLSEPRTVHAYSISKISRIPLDLIYIPEKRRSNKPH